MMGIVHHLSILALGLVLLTEKTDSQTTQASLELPSQSENYRQLSESIQATTHEYTGPDANHQDSMAMYFTANVYTVILFQFWRTDSVLGLFLSCLAVFLMAALFQGLISLPTQHAGHLVPITGTSAPGGATRNSYGTLGDAAAIRQDSKWRLLWLSVRDGGKHMLRQTGHYVLMLIVMTFNVWIGLAVILGGGVGHVVVSTMASWRKEKAEEYRSLTEEGP